MAPTKTKEFKNASGAYYTQGMFYEMSIPPRPNCIYTLKKQDYEGFPSLYKLFMETGDLTGWAFADRHLGGWDHLQKLLELPWFLNHYDSWMKELEVKIRAQALNNLLDVSKDSSSRNYTEVNKFLLNKGWKAPEDRKPKGAPTKAEIRRAATEVAEHTETVASEALRVLESVSIN